MEFFQLTSIIHVVPGVECQWYSNSPKFSYGLCQQSAVRGLQILALLGDWRTLDLSTRRRDSSHGNPWLPQTSDEHW